MDLYLKAASDMQIMSYLNLAALTVVVYDIFFLFPREKKFIWSSQWSIVKTLYVICRYYGPFLIGLQFAVYSTIQHSLSKCKIYLWFTITAGPMLLLLVVDVICVMRLYSLYDKRRPILFLLCALSLGEIAAFSYFAVRLAQTTVKAAFLPPDFVRLPGCLSILDEDIARFTWIFVLAFQCTLFSLTLIKFFQTFRRTRLKQTPGGLPHVLIMFFKSGTVLFFAMAATVILNAVAFSTMKGAMQQVGIVWVVVAQSTSGSRLVLDLRGSSKDEDELDESRLPTSSQRRASGARPLSGGARMPQRLTLRSQTETLSEDNPLSAHVKVERTYHYDLN